MIETLIAIVVIVLVVSVLWQVFGVGALFATLSPTSRLIVALLGLLIIVWLLWWFLTRSGLLAGI